MLRQASKGNASNHSEVQSTLHWQQLSEPSKAQETLAFLFLK